MTPRVVVFDLDGTIYRGGDLLPHAQEAVAYCLEVGIEVRYVTNNSTVSSEEVCLKLRSMGVFAEESWVLTSALLAAQYCRKRDLKRIEVIGEENLLDALVAEGLEPRFSPCTGPVDAVVTGLDRGFNFDKLASAMVKVLDGAAFIATNADRTFPLDGGRLAPGAGAIVSALSSSTGRSPEIIGKPEPQALQQIATSLGVPLAEVLMVGDRYDTDIICGQRAGTQTWMVLTGVADFLPHGQPGSSTLEGFIEHLKAL